MGISVSLDFGHLTAELTGENRQEVQEELVEFLKFVEENEDVLEIHETWEPTESAEIDSLGEQDNDVEEHSHDSESSYGDIPDRTGLNSSTLSRYFDLDSAGDEPPYLNFDAEVLGETGSGRSEKQMRGSLILFTLWRECMGIESLTSSELKDALRISGIDDSNLYNMYGFNDGEGDRYFRREGSGQNTNIELTLPGQREGYDQVARTVSRLESNNDE